MVFQDQCIYIHVQSCANRGKFRSQTSDLWTDDATIVRTVREEKEDQTGEGSEERRSRRAKR